MFLVIVPLIMIVVGINIGFTCNSISIQCNLATAEHFFLLEIRALLLMIFDGGLRRHSHTEFLIFQLKILDALYLKSEFVHIMEVNIKNKYLHRTSIKFSEQSGL